MYRILIADDEPLEREGMELIIKSMLSRPCEIIHAENGREALQKAAILKPHIVLMDIRMPGIDGLKALRMIKTEQPYIKMVLVTAYEYFDYAKEAIHLGVKDYIVKPAKRSDIIALLEKLMSELDTEQMEKQIRAENVNKLSQFTRLAKTELALGFMSEQMSEEALASLADLVQFPLQHCCAMVIALPEIKDDFNVMEHFVDKAIEKNITDRLHGHFTFVTSTILNNHMAVFVSALEEQYSKTMLNDIGQIGQDILIQLHEKLSIDAYIGIGNVNRRVTGIKRSYFEAIFASTNVNKEQPLCLFDQIKQRLTQPLQLSNTNDALYVKKAIEQIRYEREHQTFNMIDRVTEYITKNYNRELSLEEAAEYIHLNPYYFSKVFKQQTGETFIDYLTHVRISHAKKWMEQKDLSLKEICYLVGYNDPNYLSRVFKKVVGQTPSEYRQSLLSN